MSFWPFGPQSPRKSNIDYILNDYFDLLRRLEALDSNVVPSENMSSKFSEINSNSNTDMRSVLLHGTDSNRITPVDTKSLKNDKISMLKSSNINEDDYSNDVINNDDSDYIYDLSKINSLRIEDIMSYNNSSDIVINNKMDLTVSPSKSSISSLLFFSSNDSFNNKNNGNSTSNNIQLWLKLNSSFIDKVLREDNLIDELISLSSISNSNSDSDDIVNVNNSRLIDFLCLGYFFDENTGLIVHHIDYLIDKLLWCLDNIGKETFLERNKPNFNNLDDYLGTMDESTNFNNSNNIPILQNTINSIFPIDNYKTHNDNNSYSPLLLATCISDILSQGGIWLITELVVKSKERLIKLWSILNQQNCQYERSSHLSIFLKIHETLLFSRQTDYLNFIRNLPSLVDDILRHNNIPILLDFLLKIISTDKPDCPTGIIDTVHDQNLIPKCLEFFDNNKYSGSIQTCITDFLKMLVEISSNIPIDDFSIGPNKLTRQLCSSKITSDLVDIILREGGSALCNIVTIIIELIRKNNTDYDKLYTDEAFLDINRTVSERDPVYLGDLLQSFTERLPELIKPLKQDLVESHNFVHTRNNTKYIPIGMVKLRILELIAELIHCSNMTSLNLHISKHFSLKINQDRSLIEKNLLESQNDNNNFYIMNNENSSKTMIDMVGSISDTESNKVNFEETNRPYCITEISIQLDVLLRENAMVGDQFKIKLFDQNFLPKLISTLLKCPWNNMFHNVIFDIIQQILNGRIDSSSYNVFLIYSLFFPKEALTYIEKDSDNGSVYSLFQNCTSPSIVDTIIEGYKQNYKFYKSNNNALGYMGHLVIITEEVLKFLQESEISKIFLNFKRISNNESWNYLVNVLLIDMRVMYSGILGGSNYMDDGNGNLLPQIPISSSSMITDGSNIVNTQIENDIIDKVSGVGSEKGNKLDDMMTESQFYDKIKKLFIIDQEVSNE
ncbi:hypothetical protein RI543_001170 [Arxiozyma heterogenica]|uniref:Uncharacterized protein n=1 Tax=Arxiozyma heterogenica TaxID=278026 RepID=A0AAN7WM65_9SACH|nr:hypothetical protein RI543_001170 [Kazachstania heterogenica]